MEIMGPQNLPEIKAYLNEPNVLSGSLRSIRWRLWVNFLRLPGQRNTPVLPLHANELSKLEAALTFTWTTSQGSGSILPAFKKNQKPQAHTKLYLEHLYTQTEDLRSDCRIFNEGLNKRLADGLILACWLTEESFLPPGINTQTPQTEGIRNSLNERGTVEHQPWNSLFINSSANITF